MDPNPHQNVTDPQHCLLLTVLFTLKKGVGSRVRSGSGSASKCNGSPTLPPPNCIIHTHHLSAVSDDPYKNRTAIILPSHHTVPYRIYCSISPRPIPVRWGGGRFQGCHGSHSTPPPLPIPPPTSQQLRA